jgi:hypothetical protein
MEILLVDFYLEHSKDINLPIKTYVNGTHKVVLEIRNSAGASDTYEDTIVIGIMKCHQML